MKKIIILLILLLSISSLFSENIYFSTRAKFSSAFFSEGHGNKERSDYNRNAVSNLLTGALGLGFEMVIWDIGKKRGSRLFFKGNFDLLMSGMNFVGAYNERRNTQKVIYSLTNAGAFYMGIDWDIYFGGTFPKTDLFWGFGCIFSFLFPVYSPEYDVSYFKEKYAFYAAPTVILGYDIFIPNTNFKISPQIAAGFTCMPFIPDDLIRDTDLYYGEYIVVAYYSHFYIDISVAFSFVAIKWKQ